MKNELLLICPSTFQSSVEGAYVDSKLKLGGWGLSNTSIKPLQNISFDVEEELTDVININRTEVFFENYGDSTKALLVAEMCSHTIPAHGGTDKH